MDFINGQNISLVLFFIGFYGIISSRNIIRNIISIGIMDVAVILFFLSINFDKVSLPPIDTGGGERFADPIPQALMITAIVIGVSVTALALLMFINLYHKYGTTNWLKAKRKREGEL